MTLTDKIKQLLDLSLVFEEDQKQEWRRLMAQMNAKEMQEFYQILVDEARELKKEGIIMISDPELEKQLLPAEEEHGVDLEILRQKMETKPEVPVIPPAPMPKFSPIKTNPVVPVLKPQPAAQVQALKKAPVEFDPVSQMKSMAVASDIKIIDDLKKLTVGWLRAGDLHERVALIRAKIVELAQVNKLIPYYTTEAFEQSPLFRVYLTQGSLMIGEKEQKENFQAISDRLKQQGTEPLTRGEFEALADLRKDIENL